jgi:2-keto-4-pentenoate hydratase
LARSSAVQRRTLTARAEQLRQGDVVLSGAPGPMVAIKPGGEVRATIGGLWAASFIYGEKI